MAILSEIAPWLALVATALAILLLILVVVLWTHVSHLRRAQQMVLGELGERDIVAHAAELGGRVNSLGEAVARLSVDVDTDHRRLQHTFSRLAVVRYDAFRDSGGEQSASIALLDEHRSGIVLSMIAARDFSRSYVKFVNRGIPDRELSPEERQAVAAAVPQPSAGSAASPDLQTAAYLDLDEQ